VPISELKHADITQKIIGVSFEVHKFLGNGSQGVIYQRALQYEMHQTGLSFQGEIEQHIYYKDLPKPIGARVKIGGAIWKRENVSRILRLRCAYFNNSSCLSISASFQTEMLSFSSGPFSQSQF